MARIPDVPTAPVADEAVLAFADFDAEAAAVAAERVKQRDATDAIRASTQQTRGLNDLTRTVQQEPDFAKHGEMFEQEAAKLNAAVARQIRNPGLRKNFQSQAEQQTDAFRNRVLANVVRVECEQARVDIDAALQTHFDLYTDIEAQEPQRVQALAQLNDMIALAQARGLFTAEEVEEKRQSFLIGAVREDAALQAARDPRGFLAELGQENGRFAVLPAEDRVVMAQAAGGQAIAAAIDDDPTRVEEILKDPLVAQNLDEQQQDKARDDARIRLEAQAKAKRTEDIMAFAAETPALVARANGNETFTDLEGRAQQAGPPLTVAEVNAARAKLNEGGARPEALQLHEELHVGLIARGGPKQASVEPAVFAELMQAISAARIVAGDFIDLETSASALVDAQARVLRAERLGQITSAQAESMLNRVIPAVMTQVERQGGAGGAQAPNATAEFYNRVFDLVEATGLENDPEFTVPVFTFGLEIGKEIAAGVGNNPEDTQFLQAGSGSAWKRFVEFVFGVLQSTKSRLPPEKRSRLLQFLSRFEPPKDAEDLEKRIEELSKPPEERDSDADFDTDAGITPTQEEEREEEGASDDAFITRLTEDPQEQDEIRNILETREALGDLLREQVETFDDDKAFVDQMIAEENLQITTEEAVTIRHYTGEAYREWNERFREGKATLVDKKLTAAVVKSLRGLPLRKGSISRAPVETVEEGEAMWNSAAVGQPLDLGFQLQSFTTDKKLAARWSRDSRVIIHAKSTPRGANIEKLSKFPSQGEVLLPPGLRYMVVGKRTESIVVGKGSKRRTIEVRVIDVEIFDAN